MALLAFLAAWLAAAGPAQAALNDTMSFQGRLNNASGQPVTASVDMVFAIYDVATGGAALWTETHGGVAVSQGYYSVTLGSTTPLTLERRDDYYLGIAVGGDAEMTPRTRLTAMIYPLLPNLGQETVLVAKQNGDYTTITAALVAITDNSATRPYLIKVGPGVYEETVTMKPWVSIQGSGVEATFIIGPGGESVGDATVIAASNAELSQVSVWSNGDGASAETCAIYFSEATSYIHDVITRSYGASDYNYGVYLAYNAPATLHRVRIFVTGGIRTYGLHVGDGCFTRLTQVGVVAENASEYNSGLYVRSGGGVIAQTCHFEGRGSAASRNRGCWEFNGSSTFLDTTFRATGGLTCSGYMADEGSLVMRGCQVQADGSDNNYAFYMTGGWPNLQQVQSRGSSSGATASCYGIWYGGGGSPTNKMITLDAVTALAEGGGQTTGALFATGATVEAVNLMARGSGAASSNTGLYLSSSNASMAGGHMVGDGGDVSAAYGASVYDSTLQLLNCLVASQHTTGYTGGGIYYAAASTGHDLTLLNSQVRGDSYSLEIDSASDFAAANSQLAGSFIGGTGSGAKSCLKSYNGTMTTLNADCTTP